ncbi:MAG: phosphopantetheine-binding protein [Syntrophales bacterium]|jgi:acyl carrier protein|nr:phosphopantetheine-binding protein [Syntrophales bacterium]MDY0045506.1 phosphopantetheine-binding protein [Syntrophales bacterium]
MEDAAIFKEMVAILKPYVKDESSLQGVSDKTHILDDLKVNSARLVDIIIKCEDTFDIEIDDDDADTIRTIGDAVSVIKKKLS